MKIGDNVKVKDYVSVKLLLPDKNNIYRNAYQTWPS